MTRREDLVELDGRLVADQRRESCAMSGTRRGMSSNPASYACSYGIDDDRRVAAGHLLDPDRQVADA